MKSKKCHDPKKSYMISRAKFIFFSINVILAVENITSCGKGRVQ